MMKFLLLYHRVAIKNPGVDGFDKIVESIEFIWRRRKSTIKSGDTRAFLVRACL